MGYLDRTPRTGCRRMEMDRRISTSVAKFPLIDSNQARLVTDRRRIPDRRVNGIIVSYRIDL